MTSIDKFALNCASLSLTMARDALHIAERRGAPDDRIAYLRRCYHAAQDRVARAAADSLFAGA